MRTISQEEYDRIAGERAQAAADVKAHQAAVERARLYLHFCAISSPINGRISRRLVTEGNLVVANETLLTTIVSVSPIYAYFDVDEPTVLRIQQMVREGELTSARRSPTTHQVGAGYRHRLSARGRNRLRREPRRSEHRHAQGPRQCFRTRTK